MCIADLTPVHRTLPEGRFKHRADKEEIRKEWGETKGGNRMEGEKESVREGGIQFFENINNQETKSSCLRNS